MPNFNWKPKVNIPLITRGRIQHFLFGNICILAGYFIAKWSGRDPMLGAQFGILFVFAFALLWEGFTPWLVKTLSLDWDHPYGDFPDWLAYFLGGAIPLFILSLL